MATTWYPSFHWLGLLDRQNQRIPTCDKEDWQKLQALQDEVWKKWLHHYRFTQHTRPKWKMDGEELQKGDIVIIMDQDTKRGSWQLGKVLQLLRRSGRRKEDSDGTRAYRVSLQTSTGVKERDIRQLAPLKMPSEDLKSEVTLNL